MLKKFLQRLSRSFCVYLLAGLNLIDSIRDQSYDWLLCLSLALVALSIVLDLVSARKEAIHDKT